MTQRFSSVLVANRGEIAVRILRSAAAAGYGTIAVYSEADAGAPHVAMADEAVLIGPAPAGESYLHMEKVLGAAARTGATAIHPGYGFLSENAAFARACQDRGIVFIGPSVEAIALMGNKAAAKRRMLEAGVPCIPGYQGEDQSDAALLAAAQEIGLPVMVKAAAGGGGRGMRLVAAMDELPAALAAARSEALNAFGSAELILEKALLRPRHVELQIFGDSHGNVIHLGERDCSVQRRHQKVIEEAPCPVMTPSLRQAMGEAAINVARSVDYVGAGTVEFLLDMQGKFYFLEMNTRLQVEHPVTELICGIDLVAWQLAVAQGAALPLLQEHVVLSGHAIEVRLYAEDTTQEFLPASGTALAWQPPEGEGIRVDHGLLPGLEVSPYYDPMIAKIIAYGPDRETARRRLLRALADTVLFGVTSNRRFLMQLLAQEHFAAGLATTDFIAEVFPQGEIAEEPDDEFLCLAALAQYLASAAQNQALQLSSGVSPLGEVGIAAAHYSYRVDTVLHALSVSPGADGGYRVRIDDREHLLIAIATPRADRLRVAINGLQGTLAFRCLDGATLALQWRGRNATLVNELALGPALQQSVGSGAVLAPMHGSVLAMPVGVGDAVRVGDTLAVMEAMKMEHRLRAQVDGIVTAIHAGPGEQLAVGALLLEIEVGASP